MNIEPKNVYMKLGELVVSFQWLENCIQQIAWFLIDPEWKTDPRTVTANMWFKALLDFVNDKYNKYLDAHAIENKEEYRTNFLQLIKQSEGLAHQRNKIVHSTYIEVKAGGEIYGLLRSKMRFDVSKDKSGSLEFDREGLEDDSFDKVMGDIGMTGFHLGLVHRQLIAWHGRVTKV